MDALDPVERFLAERKKKNKRRKEKKNENLRIEVRTKSGLSVIGDIYGLTKEEVKLREFVYETRHSIIGPYSMDHYTGRVAVVDRREIEVVFAGGSFTAP